MTKQNILIGISLLLNIILIGAVIVTNIKLNDANDSIETIKRTNAYEVGTSKSEIKNYRDYIEEYNSLDKRVEKLENFGDIDLLKRVIINEYAIERLDSIVMKQDNITLVYGTITSIENEEKIIIKVNQSNNEKADEILEFEITNDCEVYLSSELGLIKASLDELVERILIEVEENREYPYTFVLLEGKVAQVYQDYHK